METKQFGARLRQLRQQSGLSQRGLANKVNVNFTYLSKIENGVVAAPSKSVILRLAEVLNADKDELLILAGRVPSDVTEMLSKDREMLQLIRSPRAHKIFKASNKVRTSLHNLTRSLQNSTAGAGSFFKNHRGLSRVAISVAMVLAIVAGLWAASPVKAVDFTFDPLTPSGPLGSSLNFKVRVDITNDDLLPIERVDLHIGDAFPDPTHGDHFQNLPIPSSPNTRIPTTGSISITGTSSTIYVSATSGGGWGYGSPGSRTGYGYGYRSTTGWRGWGYWDFDGSFGYGYGYDSSFVGLTWVEYDVTWTAPSSWPAGTYQITLQVWGDTDDSIVGYTSLTLYAPGPGVVGPGVVEPRVVEPGVTSIPTYSDGQVGSDVVAESVDGKAALDIPKDTIAKTAEGQPLREINIIPMEDPPAPPVDASILGLTYDLGPDGATFDPPITLTFTYDPDEMPEDFNEEDLVIAIWDGEKWVELEGCVVDTATHTITAPVSHFTPFTIITPAPPAPPVEEEEVVPPVVTPPVVEEEEEEEVVTPPVVEEEEEEEEVITPVVEEEEEEEEIITPVVEEEEGLAWWIWLIVGLGSATVVGLLLYFLWWRRRTA